MTCLWTIITIQTIHNIKNTRTEVGGRKTPSNIRDWPIYHWVCRIRICDLGFAIWNGKGGDGQPEFLQGCLSVCGGCSLHLRTLHSVQTSIYICGLDPRGITTRKEMQRRSSCCHGFWRKNDTQRITAIQDTDTPLDWIVRWCKMSFSFRSISGQPSNWYQPISACQRCGLCLEPNATSSVFVQFHNCWSTKKKRTRL